MKCKINNHVSKGTLVLVTYTSSLTIYGNYVLHLQSILLNFNRQTCNMRKASVSIFVTTLITFTVLLSCKKEKEAEPLTNVRIDLACPSQCLFVVDTTSVNYETAQLDFGTYQRRGIDYKADVGDRLRFGISAPWTGPGNFYVKVTYKGKAILEHNGSNATDYYFDHTFE